MPFVRLNTCIIVNKSLATAKAAVMLERWHEIIRVALSLVKMIFYSVNCSEWTLSFQFIACRECVTEIEHFSVVVK